MFAMLLVPDLINAQIQQYGKSTLPNQWMFMCKSWNSSPLFERYRKLRASLSFSCTITWWNIFSMSTITLYCSCLKRSNFSTRLFNKSGPLYSFSFEDVFSYLAPALKTTLIFPGLFMLVTVWCGMQLMISLCSSLWLCVVICWRAPSQYTRLLFLHVQILVMVAFQIFIPVITSRRWSCFCYRVELACYLSTKVQLSIYVFLWSQQIRESEEHVHHFLETKLGPF